MERKTVGRPVPPPVVRVGTGADGSSVCSEPARFTPGALLAWSLVVLDLTVVGDPEARVIVFGQDGNDWIDASRLARSAVLHGGDGYDWLFGGLGADVLKNGERNFA